MRVFVTREIAHEAIERIAAQHDVEVWTHQLPPSAEELRHRCHSSDAVLSLLTDAIDRQLLDSAPRLRVVSNYAVGFENVDVATATERGIPVGHTPGVLTEATAQLALTLVLDLLRRVGEADKYVRAGLWRTWEPQGFLGRGLIETTLGLVGYGRIGRAVAAMARHLGMTVVYSDHQEPDGLSLEEVLRQSHVLSLHATLTVESRHLINAESLALMPKGALLVNVARGAMVDTEALADAIESGHLAGAALDVSDPEPLPADHRLLDHPNVIVTPHIASATVATREAMAVLAADNLLAGLRGEPMRHCANPEVYRGSPNQSLRPADA